jgi:hypothetical protein
MAFTQDDVYIIEAAIRQLAAGIAKHLIVGGEIYSTLIKRFERFEPASSLEPG